jgi:hypothetical protein
MFKRFLSGILVLTLIAGFAQNPMPPIEVLAAGVLPSFIPGAVCATGPGPWSVATADLNGDSSPDIVVANVGSYYPGNTVSVLLNNGSGTFAPKVDYTTGTQPNSVAAADLNGDSHPDIVVTNQGSDTVSVLLNNGNGTFAPKVDYPTGTVPSSVTAVDLNDDSRPDIVVSNAGSDTVSVLLNNGGGTFAPRMDYSTGTRPESVVAADLNGDSHPDIIVANYYNPDNSSTVSVLLNNGNGTFAAKVDYPTGIWSISVAAADLNGDSYPDIVVANFSRMSPTPVGSDTVNVLLNNGNGTFAPKVAYPTGHGPISVATADLNGDSSPDIIVASRYENTVSVQLNDGSGNFAPRVVYSTVRPPSSVTAADLNGDSRPDIIVTNDESDTVRVLLNAAVSLSLSPVATTVNVGSTFDVVIKAEAGTIGVAGVDAFLNFDPTKLTVVDMDAGTTGTQIIPGTELNTVLTNSCDNTTGTIDISVGKLGTPYPEGAFIVATIRFQALAVTATTTNVSYSTTGERKTSVTDGFGNFTGTLTGATVQIITGATVDISVLLQGDSRPGSGWIVPLTVKFFNPGADVMTATSIYTFNLTTAKNGNNAVAQCTGVTLGNYDIAAFSEHTLLNVKRNVTINMPLLPVYLGTLLEGNANNNDRVNILDFGLLATSYGKSKGNVAYNPMADFDRNDIVNIFDFGLLSMNYLKIAPIEVP